jgi:hypothetical protein
MARQPRPLEINLDAASEAAYTNTRRIGSCINMTIATIAPPVYMTGAYTSVQYLFWNRIYFDRAVIWDDTGHVRAGKFADLATTGINQAG